MKSGNTSPKGRRTCSSVVPRPTPFTKFRAIAAFPFSMQGVIFAKSTSPSSKFVYPLRTSRNFRTSGLCIDPVTSSIADIGTKVTGSSGETTFGLCFGLTSQICPKDVQAQRGGKSFLSVINVTLVGGQDE